jgi:hypothetical protein
LIERRKEVQMNEYPDENDIEGQMEDNIETSNELQEEYIEDNSPTYSKPDDLYSLFWKTIQIEDSSKVGNLDKTELGMLDISVRDCQNIALVAKILKHKGFAKWMESQAQIILRTSASKKGWLTELFVTAKKFASKEKRMGVTDGIPIEQKKSFWGRKR